MKTWAKVGLAIVALNLVVGSSSSSAQPNALPGRTASSGQGRFQLVPEPNGTMFLLDTASGRVWRYTHVVPSDTEISEIKASVDKEIASRESSSGIAFSEADRKALHDILFSQQMDQNNPCTGLVNCFVEVDRIRLTLRGKWQSEVVGK